MCYYLKDTLAYPAIFTLTGNLKSLLVRVTGISAGHEVLASWLLGHAHVLGVGKDREEFFMSAFRLSDAGVRYEANSVRHGQLVTSKVHTKPHVHLGTRLNLVDVAMVTFMRHSMHPSPHQDMKMNLQFF